MNLDKWVNAISERDSVERAASYSLRDRIACLQQFFPIAAISRSECVEDVHQLRTTARRALAVLEVYAELFPTKSTERANAFIEQLQERLGRLQDHVVAHKLFCNWNSKRNRISRSCDLESLIQGEFEMLQKEQYGFAAWWTPALKAEMREAFNQLAS